jgi:hydroxymethylbilane synthase
MKIRIATRKSPLALWQAQHVAEALAALDPNVAPELVERSTKGDRIVDQSLSKVGGKDLFVKEIEDALLSGEAELAVHSLKDMPTELPAGLEIVAFMEREDPRDALVGKYSFATLPKGARVGTSSLRRAAQLLSARPDLVIVPIRGNVQTRLSKLDSENLAATILAYAGLKRLGLADRATEVLAPELSLPAIGQGILAVEARSDRTAVRARAARLDHPASRAAALAERAFLHRLHGGCQVPIAAYARIEGPTLSLLGLVASVDGKTVFRGEQSGAVSSAAELGIALADRLLDQGAGPVLEALRGD